MRHAFSHARRRRARAAQFHRVRALARARASLPSATCVDLAAFSAVCHGRDPRRHCPACVPRFQKPPDQAAFGADPTLRQRGSTAQFEGARDSGRANCCARARALSETILYVRARYPSCLRQCRRPF
eukprot:1687516-Pyramimonas_sp.AAC.1